MKKLIIRTLVLYFTLLIIIITNVTAVDYGMVDYPIFYNNTRLKFSNPIIQIENITYVPLREYNDFVNISTNWDDKKSEVITRSGNIADFSGRGTEDEPIRASIISLISNPDIFQDKYVSVIGVGNIEYETDAIFLGYDDWNYSIFKNSIALCLDDINKNLNLSDMKKLNGKYVEVCGVFDKNYSGTWGLFSGSINSISTYNECEDYVTSRKDSGIDF